MIKNKHWLKWLGVLLLPLLYSCEQVYYSAEVEIEKEVWTYATPVNFEFDIDDTSVVYNVFLDVKHRKDYVNQNAYAKLRIHLPSGDTLQPKAVSIELASKAGEWLGECSGQYCTHRLSFLPNATFEEEGHYKIDFQQYTRKDSLQGIHSLKLQIEKTDKKKGASSEEQPKGEQEES